MAGWGGCDRNCMFMDVSEKNTGALAAPSTSAGAIAAAVAAAAAPVAAITPVGVDVGGKTTPLPDATVGEEVWIRETLIVE